MYETLLDRAILPGKEFAIVEERPEGKFMGLLYRDEKLIVGFLSIVTIRAVHSAVVVLKRMVNDLGDLGIWVTSESFVWKIFTAMQTNVAHGYSYSANHARLNVTEPTSFSSM